MSHSLPPLSQLLIEHQRASKLHPAKRKTRNLQSSSNHHPCLYKIMLTSYSRKRASLEPVFIGSNLDTEAIRNIGSIFCPRGEGEREKWQNRRGARCSVWYEGRAGADPRSVPQQLHHSPVLSAGTRSRNQLTASPALHSSGCPASHGRMRI